MTNNPQEELLDRTIDFVFKRLFASQEHSPALLDLLNAVFGAFNQPLITALTVLNPSLDPDHDGDKTAILDIRAVTRDGQSINVEMQMVDSGHFIHRMLYYWSELYGETLHAGQDYAELRRTITVNFLNFNLFSRDRMISLNQLQDNQDHQVLTDLLQIYLIELPKLGRHPVPEHLQQWLKFLTIRDTQELKHLAHQNPAIGEAFDMLNYISQDPEERRRHLSRKMAMMDMRSALKTAEQRGKEEGKAEGEALVLQRQLTKRFGSLPDWVVDKLNLASTDQLECWSEKILDASSFEAFFE